METTRRTLMGGAAGLALSAAGCVRNGPNADAQLSAILDRLSTDVLRESPETATSLGVSETQAGGRYIDKLSDPSREALTRFRSIAQHALTDLRALNRESFETDRVSLDVVAASLEDIADVAFEPSARYPYQVTQLSGSYISIPDFLASQHPITNRGEVDAYLMRLSAYAHVLDTDTTLITSDSQRGITLPDFALDRAIEQQQGFASIAPAQNVLVSSLAERIANVAQIPESDRANFLTRAETIVRDDVLPAYGRQIAALRAVRLRATHDAGVWKLPRGEDLYATALRVQTSTNMTPDEVHHMGLDLMARHTAEMDAVLKTQGLSQGTVAERLTTLGRRPDQLYPNTDAGRTQCLSDLNEIVRRATAAMPQYFNKLARALLEIKRIPTYSEAGSSGGYYQQGAIDGSRPGAYYINLRDMNDLAKFGLPTLTYHEGVPGHHWQLSIQQEAQGIPFYRSKLSFFGAYGEGWGCYAEQLMDESGVYNDDPLGRLGYLRAAAFRAARLVVDTGMHAKRWSREQAMETMRSATGSPQTTEIERYAVWPAQACCYMVGKQALLRARGAAQQAMGSRFDLKGFHDIVLKNGAMPLSVAERLVQAWSQAR